MLLPSHLTLRKPYASLLSFLLTLFVVQVDIIASRGSPEPDWLMCMGYVYIRSTPSTLEFLSRFIKRLVDVKDDQRAFNLVLKYGLHLTWNKNPFVRNSFSEVIVGTVMKPPMQVSGKKKRPVLLESSQRSIGTPFQISVTD